MAKKQVIDRSKSFSKKIVALGFKDQICDILGYIVT